MRRQSISAMIGILLGCSSLLAQTSGNLLRNGEFQDDWITLLPETKNHHWCFPSEFFNRRDYNPDGWYCKGSWAWQNADAAWGQRRLVINGPAELYQRVNWIAIHDDRQLEGFPDAGGYPVMKAALSSRPQRLVRDLTFRVKLSGKDVPKGAGQLDLGLCPPSGASPSDPMGVMVPALAYASLPLPEGNFASQWYEVKLTAADWLKAAQRAAKNAKELTLPASVSVAIRYAGKTGRLDVERAELLAAASDAPNLLANGGFEKLDAKGYPAGWSKALKYRYFPPRHYYIFNTWHNTNFPNRGFAAADGLLLHTGKQSLRMIVPSGDEMMVVSEPITLNQKEPRLIEVTAWIKTDRLCNLQIDGRTETGERLDGYNFIHKAPVSIGTDSWRMIRQVFRPRTPIQSLRLILAARGVNGYTLDDTGEQPQNNVVGTIWWDDVRVTEPESDAAELHARGVKALPEIEVKNGPHLVELDLGERLHGRNTLRAVVYNPGPAKKFELRWDYKLPNGASFTTGGLDPQEIPSNGKATFFVPYSGWALPMESYTEYRGRLTLADEKQKPIQSSEIWFGAWRNPIKLDLGALYLRPQQKQFVRINLGLSQALLADLKLVRLKVVRRGDGQVLKTQDVDATPKALLKQRAKIPVELRDDFANLLLADLDVSFLPVVPFYFPQRNWIVRACALDNKGEIIASVDSQPFCALDHDRPQPAIKDVSIKNGMTYINGQPWLPWGVSYGHTPVYAGPADPGPGKFRDLHNLPGWSMYDRHNSASSNRKEFDFNCLRYVAGSITNLDTATKRWNGDNLYCSSAFAIPGPAFSLDDLFKQAGGKDKLDAYLDKCRTAPMVVSIAPGIEEAFGLFQGATPQQLQGMAQGVEYVRKKSGRPVMVGHGGYWNRFEFEKAPFFDIFDPETEPLYPANLHTDLAPLIKDKNKVVWLRPQMYESVPYERWRFHTYVELMRGCRGWQIAHGPGDASLFRGLHGEMEFFKPIVASTDAGPKVRVEPWLEHWSRRHQGKTYVIAASTHGIPLGRWDWSDDTTKGMQLSRLTQESHELRDESNAYGIGQKPESGGLASHGIQYLPYAKSWLRGTKLVQWMKLDADDAPKGFSILVKGDGRWTHAASWGKMNLAPLRSNQVSSYWFLNTFYRHAKGFLGWGMDLLPKSLDYIPDKAFAVGDVPKGGAWIKLEVPLEKLGMTEKLLDGVGFLHDGGRVWWGHTSLVAPDGLETIVWGDQTQLPKKQLERVKIHVAGLKAGTRVRVLFEDRDLVAQEGYFEDDFRGQDLYQRYGGGAGYGSDPVALHLYEMMAGRN